MTGMLKLFVIVSSKKKPLRGDSALGPAGVSKALDAASKRPSCLPPAPPLDARPPTNHRNLDRAPPRPQCAPPGVASPQAGPLLRPSTRGLRPIIATSIERRLGRNARHRGSHPRKRDPCSAPRRAASDQSSQPRSSAASAAMRATGGRIPASGAPAPPLDALLDNLELGLAAVGGGGRRRGLGRCGRALACHLAR